MNQPLNEKAPVLADEGQLSRNSSMHSVTDNPLNAIVSLADAAQNAAQILLRGFGSMPKTAFDAIQSLSGNFDLVTAYKALDHLEASGAIARVPSLGTRKWVLAAKVAP